MKFFIAICMLFSLSLAQAQSIESHFTPTENKSNETNLYMQNNCYTDAYVAVRYMDVRGQMVSAGFWRVLPGEVVYISPVNDRTYLLHAFTSDHRVMWSGNYNLALNGINYPALLVSLRPNGTGNWTTILYC
jgi:uncharacterized membrane protein